MIEFVVARFAKCRFRATVSLHKTGERLMTIKTLLTTAAITLVTATSSFAMGCQWGSHETASITCAEGTVYDADTNTCQAVSG